MNGLRVGDRIVGRFTRRKGTVTEVVAAGVKVAWDNAGQDNAVYHPDLHIDRVEVARDPRPEPTER